MPTYEYRCRDCRHGFERFQRMSDAPIRLCPSCGEEHVERLISTGGGIVFKGSGFYATDYRESGSGGGKASEKEASDDAASGSTDGASSGSSGGDAGA